MTILIRSFQIRKSGKLSDKVQWAFNAVSAIDAEYGVDRLSEDREDQFEARIDQILSQLDDDEYEQYLEMVMTAENEYGEDNDEDDQEADPWL